MNTGVNQMTKKIIHMEFDTVDCIKCGGTGFISRFAGIANGVCFMCAGSKKSPAGPKARAISKAFNEAKAKISEMKRIPISDLKVGDTIKMMYMNGSRWEKILEIKPSTSYGIKTVDGVEVKIPLTSVVTKGAGYCATMETKIEIAWSTEKKFEAIKALLPEKYQHLLKIIEK